MSMLTLPNVSLVVSVLCLIYVIRTTRQSRLLLACAAWNRSVRIGNNVVLEQPDPVAGNRLVRTKSAAYIRKGRVVVELEELGVMQIGPNLHPY